MLHPKVKLNLSLESNYKIINLVVYLDIIGMNCDDDEKKE